MLLYIDIETVWSVCVDKDTNEFYCRIISVQVIIVIVKKIK